MTRIWVLLLFSVIAVFSQVEASTTTVPTVPDETTNGTDVTDETTTGQKDPNFDKDEDDDDEEKRCRKYEEKEKDDHGKDDDDDDDDHKHHRRKCGKRKTAKLLFWIGILVVLVITGVGITICAVRYKKKRALQISQSKSTLHEKPPEKSIVYLVTDTGYDQQTTDSGWPIVSTEPLPGKQ